MLVEFSVGNYKSFKEITTFSFVASKLKSKNASLDEKNVFNANPELRLLKSSILYGANASGKSNFASAIKCFIRLFESILD